MQSLRTSLFPLPVQYETKIRIIYSLLHVVIRCTVLMISGLATYHLILSKIWKYEISVLHLGRLEETSLQRCMVPWAGNVPVLQSFLAELIGTFILDIGKYICYLFFTYPN